MRIITSNKQLVFVLIQIAKKSDHIVKHLHDLQDFTDFYDYVQEGLNTYNKMQNLAEELQSIAKLITIIINQLTFNPKINLKDMSIIAINNLINKIIKVKEVEKTLKNNLELAVIPLQKIKQDFKELLQKNSEQQLIREEEPLKKTAVKSKKQKKAGKESSKGLQVVQNQKQTKLEEFKHQVVCIKPSKLKDEKKQQQQQQIIHNQGKYQFSNIYKNRAINVIQPENSAEGFGFCVCDQAISKSGTTIIAFRIVKCDWRIHIGVCYRDMLIESKYDPNLANVGHGTYLINNQGDVFSTIETEMNDKSLSFKFYNKNIITIEIDFVQSQITWIKKQPKETFTLKFDTQKELYPCVKLWGSSKVELLNPIILQ
ncbi:unnamed protein product (macronuclear) [Paramecium tetraurelia]|uniref:SPRY domain-containing protein n=1 Tax=Paramecium tetraurelia TaxID=5888 RepID=A0C8P7_PARTE|nr:uncharacterized protein GSPATT00036299001 [Paramecium tetraurelia]CAK67164.1 unnamed protein product [Paramecium tetraurelia]|eukprot:XP_001434561.1 hypothetical protein (macronuclear) [Paramecium tetraurelia strain d4-2]